jgi:hypothetical protein
MGRRKAGKAAAYYYNVIGFVPSSGSRGTSPVGA